MKSVLLLLQAILVFGILLPWRASVERFQQKDLTYLGGAIFATTAALSLTGMVLVVLLGEATGLNGHIHASMASQYENMIRSVVSKHSAPINLKATMLTQGHRCASPLKRFPTGEPAHCVSANGQPILLPAKSGYRLACCTEVIIGSELERLAGVRRLHAQAQRGFDNGLISYFIWSAALVALVTVLPVTAFVVIRMLIFTPLSMAMEFTRTSINGLVNVPQVIGAPRLTSANFQRDEPAVLIACQLSDLHLVAPDGLPVEHKTDPESWLEQNWGPLTATVLLNRASQALRKAKELSPPVVLVTGDITDRGLPEEWKCWQAAIAAAGPWDSPTQLLAVPGNHDLTFSSPDDPDPRCSRYLPRLRLFHQNSNSGKAMDFPQVYPINAGLGTPEKIELILLNSNEYRSQHLLSGALGRFGSSQLNALSQLLLHKSGPILVAMHHHIGPVEREGLNFLERMQDKFMLCLDGGYLIEMLRAYRASSEKNAVLIVHGHRHRFTMATDASGEIKLLGIPSSTLGMHKKKGGRSVMDGVQYIATISLTSDFQWQVDLKQFP